MSSHGPHIFAVKATYDGQHIVLPDDVRGIPPGDVIVIFEDPAEADDRARWHKAQESSFGKVWDNSEDEVYDRM